MRVHTIEKARTSKTERRCGRPSCGRAIKPGDRYFYWEPRYGPRQLRCGEHYPRPSETASNDKLAQILGAQEDAYDRLDTWDGQDHEGLQSILDDARSEAEEVQGQYEESADNMEEYFSGSDRIDDLREKADACQDWADQLHGHDVEEFDEAEARVEAEVELGVPADLDEVNAWMEEFYPDREDFERAVEEGIAARRATWAEEQRASLRDVIDGLEIG